MKLRLRTVVFGTVVCAIALMSSTGCTGNDPSDAQKAQAAAQRASNRQNYEPKNDVEGSNYNARIRLSDDPNTILWCSVYPTNPNVKPYTVPVVGKLTSSSKRPYSTTYAVTGVSERYSPEVAGPDGMFGDSTRYRYGFDPAGNYWDFSETLEMACSSVPTVIQKNTTVFAITAKGDIGELSARANAALKACNNNDPSKPCAAAAQVLGIATGGK